MKKEIEINGLIISMETVQDDDYISLTDIASDAERKPAYIIRDWLRNGKTLLFLEEWEKLHNPDFKVAQMHHFRLQAQSSRSSISPSAYIEQTNAIGLLNKSGRGGGTYAHRDIALHFCNYYEPVFYVYMIKAFQKLIEERHNALSLKWHLSKITDNIDEVRNLLDTIPGQAPERNRLNVPAKKNPLKNNK